MRIRFLSLFLFLQPLKAVTAETANYDVIVYGGTSAAVVAAVQVKKMGHSVLIICPDRHLGGLSSSGLGWTDSGDKATIGGLARDFYHRIYLAYQDDAAWKWQKRDSFGNRGQGTMAIDGESRTMWIFEPRVAERVFETMILENQIPVIRNQWLNRTSGVKKNGASIEEITTLSGSSFRAKMFIDATYEGDLMAAAGITYRVGRESSTEFDEPLNGNIPHHDRSHQFNHPVDPYVIPGEPKSGLLPRIDPQPIGSHGQGDHRVQAYCYRMCLTDHPENRVPFPKPEGYDPQQYALLLRYIQAGWDSKGIRAKFDPIPNHKTDTNNHGAFSFDNIGMNYAYPDASYEQRNLILQEHRTYQQGLLYFLANDPAVPLAIRRDISKWGLPRDEFIDNDHWPHQIYVREARRMVGDTVVTQNHLTRKLPTLRSIGMGSYNMDSHHVRRYVDKNGHARNEGDVQVKPGGPYVIDLGAVMPKKVQAQNLLVPVCCSTTHIAYGSIRMEPVFMILAQSAATAAVLALENGIAVQDLSYPVLRAKLLAEGQVLEKLPPP